MKQATKEVKVDNDSCLKMSKKTELSQCKHYSYCITGTWCSSQQCYSTNLGFPRPDPQSTYSSFNPVLAPAAASLVVVGDLG